MESYRAASQNPSTLKHFSYQSSFCSNHEAFLQSSSDFWGEWINGSTLEVDLEFWDYIPSLKLTSFFALKMDGWSTILSFWGAFFQGRAVSFREGGREGIKNSFIYYVLQDDLLCFFPLSLHRTAVDLGAAKGDSLFPLTRLRMARHSKSNSLNSSFGRTC